ncbi:MAG: hypothetical protein ACQETG_08875 [Thermodesulfobacteriota bacterium]
MSYYENKKELMLCQANLRGTGIKSKGLTSKLFKRVKIGNKSRPNILCITLILTAPRHAVIRPIIKDLKKSRPQHGAPLQAGLKAMNRLHVQRARLYIPQAWLKQG